MSLFSDSIPSLKFETVGTTYTGTVTKTPELVQSIDFDTQEPAFWPADQNGKRNPKMCVVVTLELTTGEERTIWAQKPSSMYAALGAAEKAAGVAITEGGTLTVTMVGTERPKSGRGNDKKLFTATYRPGSVFGAPADPAEQFVQGGYVQPAPLQVQAQSVVPQQYATAAQVPVPVGQPQYASQPVADTPQPVAPAAAPTPPQPDVLSQASALLAAGLTAENVALALKAQGHDVDAATIAALGNAR